MAIEKAVEDEPGDPPDRRRPWISVGWNQAGLSLTGNELSPNDERVGISRTHQVFEMLRARNLHEMVAQAIRPDRASSYNNVLADRYGDVANVEGSATDVEITHLDEDDHLTHTNHYVSERMRGYEGDPEYAVRSDVRFCRARDLLADQAAGSVTPEVLRSILSDHENPERGLPPSRVGPRDVEDRVLVHRGRDRGAGAVRPREPLRLDGPGVRLRRLRRRLKRGGDPLDRRRIPFSVARSSTVLPSSFVAAGSAPAASSDSTLRRSPLCAAECRASSPRTAGRSGSRRPPGGSARRRPGLGWRPSGAPSPSSTLGRGRPPRRRCAAAATPASGCPKNAAKCSAVKPSPA